MPGAVNLAVKASGAGKRKAVAEFAHIGENSERLDLPDKIFGKAIFIHDMATAKHGACPRRAPA